MAFAKIFGGKGSPSFAEPPAQFRIAVKHSNRLSKAMWILRPHRQYRVCGHRKASRLSRCGKDHRTPDRATVEQLGGNELCERRLRAKRDEGCV